MTQAGLVTATGAVTLDEAEKVLMANKVEKLLLVDEMGVLTGLITIKDIDMLGRFPNACKDNHGRLRVMRPLAYLISKERKSYFQGRGRACCGFGTRSLE